MSKQLASEKQLWALNKLGCVVLVEGSAEPATRDDAQKIFATVTPELHEPDPEKRKEAKERQRIARLEAENAAIAEEAREAVEIAEAVEAQHKSRNAHRRSSH